jgi:hypothetical protein
MFLLVAVKEVTMSFYHTSKLLSISANMKDTKVHSRLIFYEIIIYPTSEKRNGRSIFNRRTITNWYVYMIWN